MVFAFLLLVTVVSATARAEDVSGAKRLFISGSKHFDLGEYELALTDFKEAYRIKDDPVLLYNIAQCHRLLKHNEEALRAYKTFLRRAPDSPVRPEVEQRIVVLEEAIDKQNRASTMPPDRVLGGSKPETPPATTPAPAATTAPGTTAAPPTMDVSANQVSASAAPRRRPLYKQWWLWTAVGAVVVVGLGVGLGVGLSHSGGNSFPAVSW